MRLLYAFLFSTSVLLTPVAGEVIARSGKGWLEEQQGQLVLHLKGSHYEMGRQHGELLRDHVQQNLNNLVNVKGETTLVDVGPLKLKPRAAIELIVTIQRDFVPDWYFEELRGLAEGAELPEKDVQVANFIPELFHCSGFAIMNSATKDGTLYHGRVLDYAIDWGLQDHAVVIVSEPDGGIPFVNISYAGFIGCVTGMNANHISIGEMGGAGLGHWHGMPMAVLMREALQTCSTLDEVLDLYRATPRTCQYFYVVADGNTNRAVGMEASWDRMDVIHTGEKHERLPIPVTDCALLSAGSRYEELVTRVQAGHGTFTAEEALHLMDRPVAMKSNLHNVLFEPATTRFWVSNAGSDGTPAAERPYTSFDLRQLLSK
ncbi:MAG: peptidase C45 [Planctomycetaceae bacterium]|nr:peptidase C45 [Planctomycetaceae bacterium]MCB9952557.1 peptidase C45 [Planctomycetaceae bacterium]